MALVPPPNAAGIIPPADPQDPPMLSDITNSKEYVARLHHSKKYQIPGAATDNEIGLAERYHHEVVLKNSLMGAAPPPWLAPFIAVPPPWLAQFINNIEGDMNEFRADMNEFRADMNEFRAEVRAGLNLLESRQENMKIGKLNQMEVITNSGITTYQLKRKEVAGDGTALANTLLPHGFAPLVALQEVPAVGARIAPMINTHGLTHQDILRSVQFYNYDFGIQPGETVPVRTKKIENWLTVDV